jgi:predicted ArsR family transcriptional regulator
VPEEEIDPVAGIGSLVEPVRRALYRYVAGQPQAVGRERAAAALSVPVHTAKFHLDRLVEEGLLEVEFRRLTGRSGPGAGRPAKLYRRSKVELSVSLPERRYDLAGQILATAVDRSVREEVPAAGLVQQAARDRGRAAAVQDPATGEGATEKTLAGLGYEPRADGDDLVLANCPFDALARQHTDLVCGLNLSFVEGLLDGLGDAGFRACLDPDPQRCCVRLRSTDRA